MRNGVGLVVLVLLVLLGSPWARGRPVEASKKTLFLPNTGSSDSSSRANNLHVGISSTGSNNCRGGFNSGSNTSKQQAQQQQQQDSRSTIGSRASSFLGKPQPHSAVSATSGHSITNQRKHSHAHFWAGQSGTSSSRSRSSVYDALATTITSSSSGGVGSRRGHAASVRDSSSASNHTHGSATTDSSSNKGTLAVNSSSTAVQVSRRHLQQSALCPEGCAPGYCVRASNDPQAGFKCQQCLNNLVVDKVSGLCACPAGRYSRDANSCTDCPKGSYCDGGVYARDTPSNQPVLQACPGNMNTLGLRSTSLRACVNLPGYFYAIILASGAVAAVVCPVNTYGPGFRKQRACVPCPTNYGTNGLTGRTSPMNCVVPPGYYLKMPGVVAPCPMGEWKDGTGPAGNCTKCAFGVTTPTEASTSALACSVLLPGYYAASLAASGVITAAAACPQKYWCPGGVPGQGFDPSNPGNLAASEPSIQRCPAGSWTQERAAVSPDQCLTPPGFYTSGGDTQQCPDGAFRSDWLPPQQAASCTACGSGVFGDKSDRITVCNLTTGVASLLPVMTSSSDCYIQPGQGLMYSSISQTFRARNCEDSTYGVPARFYGLTPFPCRPCPTGLIASNNVAQYPNSSAWWVDNGDGTRGFLSVKACVTQAGYGYNSRVAQPCDAGYYNQRDTYKPCSPCPAGLTTSGVGAGSTAADCGMKAGYGFYSGAVTPCPLGTYNDVAYAPSTTTTCTSCPAGTTTAAAGADSVAGCSLCGAGYGGPSCSTVCGGAGVLATYGPPGRAVGTPCVSCTSSATGYSFDQGMSNDLFAPQPVSPPGASSAVSCLTEFAQFADGAWWLPTAGDDNMAVASPVASFAACVATCTSAAKCEYITYDYNTQTCYTRTAADAILAGTPWVGFKAVPSGDVGSAWSMHNSSSNHALVASSAASGLYSWYQDPNFATIGVQSAAPGAGSFTAVQRCLDACDDDPLCAGVVLKPAANPLLTPRTCVLIHGDTTLGVFKRSMTRADTARLAMPLL